MPGLNEADTCRVYITPALRTAGWCDPHWRIAEQNSNAADKAEVHFKKLTSGIKEGKTDFISALDEGDTGFILTPKERDLFNPKTQMETDVITLEVDIFRYDKASFV